MRGGKRFGTGGRRPGAGRPRKQPSKAPAPRRESATALSDESPLEYMLRIMNDPGAPLDRRDRMAVAAAQYMHPKVGEKGKKAAKDEAARKLASRFMASKPPRSVN